VHTNLKLISKDAAAAQLFNGAFPSVESTVFTPDFRSRLTSVTSAERALRAAGVCVVSVQWLHPLPAIRIKRDPGVSLKPILDEIDKLHFEQPRDGRYDVWGVFHGVTVCWQEAVPQLSADTSAALGEAV